MYNTCMYLHHIYTVWHNKWGLSIHMIVGKHNAQFRDWCTPPSSMVPCAVFSAESVVYAVLVSEQSQLIVAAYNVSSGELISEVISWLWVPFFYTISVILPSSSPLSPLPFLSVVTVPFLSVVLSPFPLHCPFSLSSPLSPVPCPLSPVPFLSVVTSPLSLPSPPYSPTCPAPLPSPLPLVITVNWTFVLNWSFWMGFGLWPPAFKAKCYTNWAACMYTYVKVHSVQKLVEQNGCPPPPLSFLHTASIPCTLVVTGDHKLPGYWAPCCLPGREEDGPLPLITGHREAVHADHATSEFVLSCFPMRNPLHIMR